MDIDPFRIAIPETDLADLHTRLARALRLARRRSAPEMPAAIPRAHPGPRHPLLRRWQTMPAGGHFAAFEQPALLAGEIRAFFRPLRGKL